MPDWGMRVAVRDAESLDVAKRMLADIYALYGPMLVTIEKLAPVKSITVPSANDEAKNER